MTTLLTLLVLANLVRVHPLHESKYLDSVAQARAEYLCETSTFTHAGWFSFWGKTTYNFVGENLATGYQVGSSTNYTEVEAAFMASPEHRANILNPNYSAIGLGADCGITVEEFGGFAH